MVGSIILLRSVLVNGDDGVSKARIASKSRMVDAPFLHLERNVNFPALSLAQDPTAAQVCACVRSWVLNPKREWTSLYMAKIFVVRKDDRNFFPTAQKLSRSS